MIDIVVMADCASNYGVFRVPSSKGDKTYEVSMHGSEGWAWCSCKAFEFGNGKPCKHIDQVWEQACMFNPQWKDGQENPKLRPVDYSQPTLKEDKCPCCGGPMVAVRRAV